MDIIFLNGQFVNKDDAQMPLMDRGLLFGDALYEVIPVYQGHLIGCQQHLDRLSQGLNATGIHAPFSHQQWLEIFAGLAKRTQVNLNSAGIYLQVSRGIEASRTHVWQEGIKPSVFAYPFALPPFTKESAAKPRSAIMLTDERRQNCFIKSTSLQVNTIAQHQAKQAGAIEAILHRDGRITEGTASNVFIVKNDRLFTHPATAQILNGVTRQILLQLAKQKKLPYEETPFDQETLLQADEVWITSSTKGLCPITQVDEKTIGDGTVGKHAKMMLECYFEFLQQACAEGHRIDRVDSTQ
jgi:D-alanine transaminase